MKLTHPCSCKACNHGCNFGSGFLVGKDKEKLAKFLKISEKELEEKYLEEKEQFNTKLFRPKLEMHELSSVPTQLEKPYGKCVFFDGKGCKVHNVKPLQCRIAMGCKDYGEDLMIWFMLNYQVNPDDDISLEQYKTYLKSGGKTIKGGEKN